MRRYNPLARAVTCTALCALLTATLSAQSDRFVDSNGVQIRYVEQGTGDPIILLHGNSLQLDAWIERGILVNLAKDYRVIAFDARGHGKSGKPRDPKAYGRECAFDVVRLMDHLDIDRAHSCSSRCIPNARSRRR